MKMKNKSLTGKSDYKETNQSLNEADLYNTMLA
jgi:hypothetical protein